MNRIPRMTQLKLNETPSKAEMEKAFQSCDATYDGIFFTAVKTTGIFCKPSCNGKKPFLKNVEFFRSIREALFAGYRPCLRCRPLELAGHPEWLNQILSRLEANPSLRMKDSDLREAGVEPSRVRRYFATHYSMTFQAF